MVCFSLVFSVMIHVLYFVTKDLIERNLQGTADVVYLRKEDAIAAISRYNNVQLDGKPMKIDLVGTSVITSPGTAAYGFGRGQSSLPMR